MYFSKKVYTVYNGIWGKTPSSWGVFENFCIKCNLTVCKVTFNCKLQKNGEQDVLLARMLPIILLGEQQLPLQLLLLLLLLLL